MRIYEKILIICFKWKQDPPPFMLSDILNTAKLEPYKV